MFQFTTTTVINSAQDLEGNPLWSLATDEDGKKSFHVKRVGVFKEDNIVSVYKAKAEKAQSEEWRIDLRKLEETPKKGDTFVLNMYIGLTEGSNYSLYANDFWFKGKPWFINFEWKGDVAKTAKALVDMIKKFDVNVQYSKLFNVKLEGQVIVISCVNGYQRMRKLTVEKIDHTANNNLGDQYVVLPLEDANGSVAGVWKEKDGIEGFGTYEFLRNNLRLPTDAHTRAFAINDAENPIPGAMYDQYTIHMCVDRGTLGNNAVGDQVTSHTTHVFYVNQALASTIPSGEVGENEEVGTFEANLKSISGENFEKFEEVKSLAQEKEDTI